MTSLELQDSLFLRACRREGVERTPIWLMRQAGRYQKSYRALREKVGFLELCKNPALASQVTVEAAAQLGVDAAIIFSDILVILEPLGVGLTFAKGEGPLLEKPVREARDLERLHNFDLARDLAFVYDAVRLCRQSLPRTLPLIGFAGAPFTLASYLIEGGSSKDFAKTRAFMQDGAAWDALMGRLAGLAAEHLKLQIEAGCQAVQVFDSWAGNLTEHEYRERVLPYTKKLIGEVFEGNRGNSAPVIHFAAKAAALLPALAETGATVIGLSQDLRLGLAWTKLKEKAVMGNLDPQALFGTREEIRKDCARILAEAAHKPGHIFNLGHGLLPKTPEDNVKYLVDTVRELSAR